MSIYHDMKAAAIANSIAANFDPKKEYTAKEYAELRTSVMPKKVHRFFTYVRQEDFEMTKTQYLVAPTKEVQEKYDYWAKKDIGYGYFYDNITGFCWEVKNHVIQPEWTFSEKLAKEFPVIETREITFTAHRYYYKVNTRQIAYYQKFNSVPANLIDDYLQAIEDKKEANKRANKARDQIYKMINW